MSERLAIDLFYELMMTERRKRGDLKVQDIPDNIQGQVNNLLATNNEIRKQKETLVFEATQNKSVKEIVEHIISHPDMLSYKLTKQDIDIIVNMVSQTLLPFHNDMNGLELLKYLNMPKLERLKNTNILESLLDRKILKLSNNAKQDYHINNPVYLLQARFDFDTLFFNALLGSSIFNQAYENLQIGIKEYQNEIHAYMVYLDTLFDNYPELSSLISRVKGNYFGQILAPYFSNMCDSFHKLRKGSLLMDVKQQYDLKDQDLMVLMLVYYHVCYKHQELVCAVLINLISANQVEAYQLSIDINQSNLVRKDLIRFMQSFIADAKCVYLHDRIRSTLGVNLSDDFSDISDLEDITNSPEDISTLLAGDNCLSISEPCNVGLDNLILPENVKDIIRVVVKKTKTPEKYNLAQWDLFAEKQERINQGIAILLYGQPGVGKTMTTGVIAHALNRKLINIEASKLRNKYYGETQQIIKNLFGKMREIIKISSPEDPVFLLNECDQLIHNRQIISDEGSCLEVENSIQNIILEELETFPGIIIMTTNLVEQLDRAFSRRFSYKIELPFPDADCRKELWRLHLPQTIPGAQDINMDLLAQQYALTGGQIKLIVQNACSEAIIRDSCQFLTQKDLLKYINLEINSSFEMDDNKKIGFGR